MQRDISLLRNADGHPFRVTLNETRRLRGLRSGDGDLKLFVLAYTTFFCCFWTFLA